MSYPVDAMYSTSLPGLDEARLLAIKALIVNDIANLNAALAVDTQTSGLVFLASDVMLGDAPQLTRSRISILAGEDAEALDWESGQYLSALRYKTNFRTSIFVYVKPDDLQGTKTISTDSPLTEATNVEVALARISDHLRRRLFNRTDSGGNNSSITLTSKEGDGSAYDVLQGCYARECRKDTVSKGVGATVWTPRLHIVHFSEWA